MSSYEHGLELDAYQEGIEFAKARIIQQLKDNFEQHCPCYSDDFLEGHVNCFEDTYETVDVGKIIDLIQGDYPKGEQK